MVKKIDQIKIVYKTRRVQSTSCRKKLHRKITLYNSQHSTVEAQIERCHQTGAHVVFVCVCVHAWCVCQNFLPIKYVSKRLENILFNVTIYSVQLHLYFLVLRHVALSSSLLRAYISYECFLQLISKLFVFGLLKRDW